MFCRLGFESILKEMIGEEAIKEEVLSDNEDTHLLSLKSDSGEHDSEGYFSMPSSQDSTNFDIKSPNAKDFFDIDELAEDEVRHKLVYSHYHFLYQYFSFS